MQLTLVPSKVMDRWARKNKTEHNKIRLSKRARIHYKPSQWDNTKLKVHGRSKQMSLILSQAPIEEIKRMGKTSAKTIGFVTTQTYNSLMGKGKSTAERAIWISENAQTITIGCDPEFVLVKKNGEAAYADNIMPSGQKMKEFGSDGPCAELRPAPSNKVAELVENIEHLLKTHAHLIEEYKWLGGATYTHPSMNRVFYIGGHIHYGLPKGSKFSDRNIQKRVVRILDELIAVPLVRIDTPDPSRRRNIPCSGSGKIYGAFGDICEGDYKFEWRVPSGIWLVHPDLAKCVLSASKAVVEEVWRRFEDKNKSTEFMMGVQGKNNLQYSFGCDSSERVRDIINKSKPSEVAVDHIRKLHSKLRGMATYSRYKAEIDEFINICCSKQMPPSKQKLDLKRGWVRGLAL